MLIVGLGNPGSNYARSRHNIGFMVIDELLNMVPSRQINNTRFKGQLFKSGALFFLKPMTYMNLSGESVAAVKNYYDIKKIVVIHDDLDLPFGSIKFKRGGGSGGHNGIKSIDSFITNDYIRIRMGISKPENKDETVAYVLSSFSKEEMLDTMSWVKHAALASLQLQNKTMEDVASLFTLKKL